MEEKLTRDEVLHVADLGRLALSEEEIEKFQYQLKQILNETDKINKVDIDNNAIMISPTQNENIYRPDETKEMLSIDTALKNAPKTNGNYLEITRVIND